MQGEIYLFKHKGIWAGYCRALFLNCVGGEIVKCNSAVHVTKCRCPLQNEMNHFHIVGVWSLHMNPTHCLFYYSLSQLSCFPKGNSVLSLSFVSSQSLGSCCLLIWWLLLCYCESSCHPPGYLYGKDAPSLITSARSRRTGKQLEGISCLQLRLWLWCLQPLPHQPTQRTLLHTGQWQWGSVALNADQLLPWLHRCSPWAGFAVSTAVCLCEQQSWLWWKHCAFADASIEMKLRRVGNGSWQMAVTVGLSAEVRVLAVKWSEMPDDSEKWQLAMQPGCGWWYQDVALAVRGGSVLPVKEKWLLTERCDTVGDIGEVFFSAMHISLLTWLFWDCLG